MWIAAVPLWIIAALMGAFAISQLRMALQAASRDDREEVIAMHTWGFVAYSIALSMLSVAAILVGRL